MTTDLDPTVHSAIITNPMYPDGADPMTQPTDLPPRLAALYETVKLNPGMVATAQQQRDRGILEALNDIVLRVEAIEAAMAENDKSLESLDNVVMDFLQRIAALEAWQEQTGEGK